MQQELAASPTQARMGLHTGTPEVRDGAYVGLDVHRSARIAAAGHGGQVLLSVSTAALAEDSVTDLGRHRLKDLEEPEHIFQLRIEDLRDTFPSLRTLEAARPDLPTGRRRS